MTNYLESSIKLFEYYKSLGEKTFQQIPEEKLFWAHNEQSNSIAVIVKHLSGNMLSRWTNFLSEDGEKQWRNRDDEFEATLTNKKEVLDCWNKGWDCLFQAIRPLQTEDLEKEIFIRNMGHTVTEAINRQLAHYSYHVGQIVFIGKLASKDSWESLSIVKGNSKDYNQDKFSKAKRKEHFTDDL